MTLVHASLLLARISSGSVACSDWMISSGRSEAARNSPMNPESSVCPSISLDHFVLPFTRFMSFSTPLQAGPSYILDYPSLNPTRASSSGSSEPAGSSSNSAGRAVNKRPKTGCLTCRLRKKVRGSTRLASYSIADKSAVMSVNRSVRHVRD